MCLYRLEQGPNPDAKGGGYKLVVRSYHGYRPFMISCCHNFYPGIEAQARDCVKGINARRGSFLWWGSRNYRAGFHIFEELQDVVGYAREFDYNWDYAIVRVSWRHQLAKGQQDYVRFKSWQKLKLQGACVVAKYMTVVEELLEWNRHPETFPSRGD